MLGRRLVIAGGLLLLSLGLVMAQQAALKKLEGRYKAVHAEKASGPAPKELIESLTITIKGNKMTLKLGDDEKSAEIKVDADQMPPAMDILPQDPDNKGKIFRAIYRLDKDELLIVISEKGDRPKDFKAEGDAVLLKLRRE
ncbi:MAG: TIGR03067 domain-containing protein [Gemmataceae bacterium]|nr:TIGR03067 domain-containing protein [Gemmataceae bacterium]MDW8243681.1 TIGR03067 domain-containing protein [Thermogemmata sp.]